MKDPKTYPAGSQTEHQGLPVSGYKPQPDFNIKLVNENKKLEENVLRAIDALQAEPSVDKRWLAVGRTMIEQGFMAINRSIFQPERIKSHG